MAAVGHGVRVDALARMSAVIEVESPMQEAGDAVQIELHAQYAVARRRLGEEPVGDLGLLYAAIIGPQARHPVFDKGFDMIGGSDRDFHQASLIESEIRQRIEGAKAIQQWA